MSTVNVSCSNQTYLVYICDKRYINLFTLVYVTTFNGIKFALKKKKKKNCTCRNESQLSFSAYSSKGIQFTKVNRLPFESLLYETCNYPLKCLQFCCCVFIQGNKV